jgi:hypothetical protein
VTPQTYAQMCALDGDKAATELERLTALCAEQAREVERLKKELTEANEAAKFAANFIVKRARTPPTAPTT